MPIVIRVDWNTHTIYIECECGSELVIEQDDYSCSYCTCGRRFRLAQHYGEPRGPGVVVEMGPFSQDLEG